MLALGISNASKPININRSLRYAQRFFQTSSVTGCVEIHELRNFTCLDLINVIILVNLENMFIWIDKSSRHCEVIFAIKSLLKLIKECTLHSQSKCLITFQDHEPFEFMSAIHGWNVRSAFTTERVISADAYLASLSCDHYPIQVIQSGPPDHLDRTRLD